MPTYEWYARLIKPSWAPAPPVFGIAWSIIYPIIAISFGYVFWKTLKKALPVKVAVPFALNLIFNLIFTPIQFGLKNNFLAAVDILAVVITLVWAMKAIFRHYKWVTIMQIPYLGWGLFATILQFSVTWLNR